MQSVTMLQPVTKVVLVRKPKLEQVGRESPVGKAESKPKESPKKRSRKKSKCQLFPLAVTSITDHENLKGDNPSTSQHHQPQPINGSSYSFIEANDQSTPSSWLRPLFQGSVCKAKESLVLQRNFRNSTERFLALKSRLDQDSITLLNNNNNNNNNCKKRIDPKQGTKASVPIGKRTEGEEVPNWSAKRTKLECLSGFLEWQNPSMPCRKKTDQENEKTFLFPHLTDASRSPPPPPPQQRLNATTLKGSIRCFAKQQNHKKTGIGCLKPNPKKSMKKLNGVQGNENDVSLADCKTILKNPEWNWFNAVALHYPRRRNLLLDWHSYDLCKPVSFQSWSAVKEGNGGIAIVGNQVGNQVVLQNSDKNLVDDIFPTKSDDHRPNKIRPTLNGLDIRPVLSDRIVKPSDLNPIGSGFNPSRPDPLLENSLLRDTSVFLAKNLRSSFPKMAAQERQLSPLPVQDPLFSGFNLKDGGRRIFQTGNLLSEQKSGQQPVTSLFDQSSQKAPKIEIKLHNNQSLVTTNTQFRILKTWNG